MSPPKWWKIKVWYRRAQTLGLLWAYPTGFHETISDVGFEYMMVIVCLFSVSIFSSKGYLSHGSKKKKKKLIWYSQTQKFQGIFPVTESESESCPVMSHSLWLHRPYSPWNCPGQNTRVGSLSLLQGTFPTQGSNPGFPHCRRILYQLSYQGSLVTEAPIWLKLFLESYKTLPLFRHFTVHIKLIIQQRYNEEMEFWKLN